MKCFLSYSAFAALFGLGLSAQADPALFEMPPETRMSAPAPPEARLPLELEPATPPPASLGVPRVAVAAIMRDTGQALLWDAKRSEYAVIRQGQAFQGFRHRKLCIRLLKILKN